MVFNIVAGGLIFAYSAWVIVKFVRKSKEGKCSACSMNKSCSSKQC